MLCKCYCFVLVNPARHAGGNYISAAINFTFLGNAVPQGIPLTPRVKAHGKVDQSNFFNNKRYLISRQCSFSITPENSSKEDSKVAERIVGLK